ncbi:MAG: proline dehydrogenase family protein [Planctomycetota bacterium]
MADTIQNDASTSAPGAPPRPALPDFSDTEETFRHLSNSELRESAWLFRLMGLPWLTNLLSTLGTWAVRWRIPGAQWGVKRTIYRQFVGGTSLDGALPTIQRLHGRGVTSILDYGAEAKSSEEDFELYRGKILEAIAFGERTPAANSIALKVTGLARNEILEALNDTRIDFSRDLEPELARVVERLDAVCAAAAQANVQVNIDAEESWFQNTVDQLADEMMRRHNGAQPIVLNTFQLYRHDRLAFLRTSFERAEAGGYLLGAKLVRGAYMEKERDRAGELGYESPIQPDLASTHRDYDDAVRFCLEHHERVGVVIGSHNENSMRLGARLMDELGIPRAHPHVQFAQLLGMSDNLTFNLAAAGFNAAKYLVYGPVTDVLPYLVRRAQENTSVTGEVGRELGMIRTERRRRRAAS